MSLSGVEIDGAQAAGFDRLKMVLKRIAPASFRCCVGSLSLVAVACGLKGEGRNPGSNASDTRFRKNRRARKPQDRRNGFDCYLTLTWFGG
jgi:hypothetical protein